MKSNQNCACGDHSKYPSVGILSVNCLYVLGALFIQSRFQCAEYKAHLVNSIEKATPKHNIAQ